jgi:hypothetical protein
MLQKSRSVPSVVGNYARYAGSGLAHPEIRDAAIKKTAQAVINACAVHPSARKYDASAMAQP